MNRRGTDVGIWVRREGEAVRQGLNVYPLSDRYSAGFILRLGRLNWRMRWSKVKNRLHVGGWISA